MIEYELHKYLLLEFPSESESCEWKKCENLKHNISGKAGDDIISYVSAISNMLGGYLVLGVKDKTLKISGIKNFHNHTPENLKFTLMKSCTNLKSEGLKVEEFKTTDTEQIVWVIHIPRHSYREPVYAHKKAWQRIGDSLVELTQERREAILQESKSVDDWSAQIIFQATLTDLDPEAIVKARKEFIKRNPKYAKDVDKWSDATFLNKAKLTIKGKITRTCMILLGKEEEEHFLKSTVKIRWNLKTINNQDKDFEVFSIPIILNIDRIYSKIRNLKYRYLRSGTLFPDEVLRYDPFNIREPLNNAIAHQDYGIGARINIVEFEDDHLIFTNYGAFLPKSVEEVVLGDAPEENYRNPFLVEAMKNLDMIETQGGGIRKMFNFQRERLFPMPEYDFSNGKVKVTIIGKVLNEDFANILIGNPSLSLKDIVLLDKVQKHKPLDIEELKFLRSHRFIEGRKPNVYLSFNVIEHLDDDILKSQYIDNRSFDDDYFKQLILEYLSKFDTAKRKSIDTLIMPKLSAILSASQKKNKVTNLLTALRSAGKIKTVGYGEWTRI